MLRRYCVAAFVTVAVLGAMGSAAAEQKNFDYPKYKNLALDWCRSWASDCGKPAADAWCVKQGYESALKISKWENAGEPTRIISNNQICDEPGCDSFTAITCQIADGASDDDEETVTFKKPKAGSRRLDWCLTYASDCGAPAAAFYCKKEGYSKATDFAIASNIGKTRILKTGENCTQPDCDGFKFITCSD